MGLKSADIAKLAGVSRSTVSRILNGYDDISYETRKKVEAIIKEYNYIPNSYGRGLAGKANRIIGLFIVDVDNWSEDSLVLSRSEVFCDFLAYAADIAHNLRYNILVSVIDRKNYENIRRLFADKSICAGLIMGDTYDQEVIDELGKEGYKIALHNQRDRSEMENVINVNVDNEAFAYAATQELLKRGHRKIGMITGNSSKYTVRKRYHGLLRALEEAGVTFDTLYTGVGDFHRADGGYDAAMQLLENCRADLPTALLVANSVMLPGVLRALEETGLRVPEDMSVIGLGGSKFATYTNPPVTDLCISSEMIASAMISKITELLNMGALSENNITLRQYELVERESIKDLRPRQQRPDAAEIF